MLWISIESTLRPAIGVLLRPTGYVFTVLAWLYKALLKQLLTQFEFFTFLTKQAFCAHRLSTLAQSDDKQPSRRQGGAWKSIGKNAYEMKVAVNAKKHIRKRYTHAIAEVSILSWKNRQQQWRPHEHPDMTNKGHMEDGVTVTCALARA